MKKFAALLISRQALRPDGATPWVRACVEAVDWLKSKQYGIVSSTGMQTWELVTALAAQEKLPLRLFVPVGAEREMIVARATYTLHFGLEREWVEFVPVIGGEDRVRSMARRDAAVVETSDLLMPISVRPDGGMTELLKAAESNGRTVERKFEVPYDTGHEPLKMEITADAVSEELKDFEDDYLIHWTRAANHAWPDERLMEYYGDVVRSKSWARSGFLTLRRILDSGRLIASSRHMPARIATVSFSGLRPIEVLPLMKWRARYSQMTFEPYGIGITRELASRLGIRAVKYYDRHNTLSMDPNQVWLWQSRGTVSDWTAEREFRCRGDLILRGIAEDAVVLFCHTPAEAEELRRSYRFHVVPFLK